MKKLTAVVLCALMCFCFSAVQAEQGLTEFGTIDAKGLYRLTGAVRTPRFPIRKRPTERS